MLICSISLVESIYISVLVYAFSQKGRNFVLFNRVIQIKTNSGRKIFLFLQTNKRRDFTIRMRHNRWRDIDVGSGRLLMITTAFVLCKGRSKAQKHTRVVYSLQSKQYTRSFPNLSRYPLSDLRVLRFWCDFVKGRT